VDEPAGSCRLTRLRDLLWTLPVEVAGRTRCFVLDLGAGVTIVDDALAAELSLREVRQESALRMTGQRLKFPWLEPFALRVAGHELSPAGLARFDLASLFPAGWPRIDGVLALDVLEKVPFAVDFSTDRLQLLSRDRGGLSPVRVRLHRQVPAVTLVVLVAVAAPAGELWFELDNSNTGPVLVSPAARARLGLDAFEGARPARIDVLGLGEVPTALAVRDLIYDGNLGRTFVDGRTLAFDLAVGHVSIGPAAGARGSVIDGASTSPAG
jgi:hypothetical protein